MRTCGNEWCCNGAHMVPATRRQNVMAAIRRGTHKFGERTLEPEQAREIYRLAWDKVPYMRIAKMFNTTVANVSNIKRGFRWADINES